MRNDTTVHLFYHFKLPGGLHLVSMSCIALFIIFLPSLFLGGLSLHLNHLIESRVTNYDWPFGTLPFGLFGSNLDTRDLETYPRTYPSLYEFRNVQR